MNPSGSAKDIHYSFMSSSVCSGLLVSSPQVGGEDLAPSSVALPPGARMLPEPSARRSKDGCQGQEWADEQQGTRLYPRSVGQSCQG